MRLQVIDTSASFSCGSCTACCDQPWRTLIEEEKVAALERHDFSAYPHLVGRKLYGRSSDGRKGFYELAKGEGTRCIFLDTDGLCIIHKELGPEAKPQMCRQFPFMPARTWFDDRVSANFGCPSVQQQHGRPLAEQADEIAELVPLTPRETRPDSLVPLDGRLKITKAESDDLFDRALRLFDEQTADNIWSPFAELLRLLVAVQTYCHRHPVTEPRDLSARLRGGEFVSTEPAQPSVDAFPTPRAAPMPVRFLFAATLYPDTLPADAPGGLGLLRRLTLMPKLMSLATLSGGYASRLLGRNVSMAEVLGHQVEPRISAGGTALLLRYCRSRLWQRLLAGTRLPIVGGVHQHILDCSAVVFLARAEAAHRNERRLSEDLIRGALTRVEFHLANQPRLFDQTLRGWLRSQLCDAELAVQSLRLMALDRRDVRAGCRA